MVRARISQIRTDAHLNLMHALIRRLLLVAAVLAAGSSVTAQPLRDSTLDSKPSWLYFFDSTAVTFTDNPNSTGSNDNYLSVPPQQHVVAFFEKTTNGIPGAVYIESGGTLQASFDLYFTSIPNNSSSTGSFRVGLFDSTGVAKPTSNSSFNPYEGYLFAWSPGNQNNLRLWERDAPTTNAQLMSSTTSVYIQRGTVNTTGYTFQTGTAYRASYSITGGNWDNTPDEDDLRFELTITEGSTIRFSTAFVVSTPSTNKFDALALYAVSSASGGPNFAVDNLLISYETANFGAVPEPSTYAACAGAAVLGLAFWRRRRTAAKTAVA